MTDRIDHERALALGLTQRHVAILAGLAAGHTERQIGQSLGLSADTIKTHIRRVRDLLGAANRCHAVAVAYDVGVLRTAAQRAKVATLSDLAEVDRRSARRGRA